MGGENACILYAISCGLQDKDLADRLDLLSRSGKASSDDEDEDPDPDEDPDTDSGSSSSKVKLKPWQQRKRKSMGYEVPSGRPIPTPRDPTLPNHCKAVGDGVFELRIDFGPGYRVYFGRDGPQLVVLLIGGDKSTQTRDIAAAKEYWYDYQQRAESPSD